MFEEMLEEMNEAQIRIEFYNRWHEWDVNDDDERLLLETMAEYLGIEMYLEDVETYGGRLLKCEVEEEYFESDDEEEYVIPEEEYEVEEDWVNECADEEDNDVEEESEDEYDYEEYEEDEYEEDKYVPGQSLIFGMLRMMLGMVRFV